MKATLFYKCTDQTGEAVTWLAATEALLWVDIDERLLHVYRMATGTHEEHILPRMVSAIVPKKGYNDEVLLALQGEIVSYHLETRQISHLLALEPNLSEIRPNDGKASPEGRFWLGTMHLSDHNETGALWCIEPDLTIHKVRDKQYIPNGIVWNAAGSKMYYADSGRGCIEEYAYDSQTGNIHFLRIAVEVPPIYGVPDGMTIDSRGFLWVAHWGGFGVYIWDPETGNLVNRIEVPVPNVASCTFGGRNGEHLYITTAKAGLSQNELEQYPLSGSLFVAETLIPPGENHYPFVLK